MEPSNSMEVRSGYLHVFESPNGEKIVSMIEYGGHYRWDFKFPFRHYVEPRRFIATEKAIYQLIIF
jgi:hypothetical protein